MSALEALAAEPTPKITGIRSIKPFHAHVTVEPLSRGFGHTLGNALRRVLISAIPGYAATEAKIDGVVHEYDSVPGMREDVIWMLLNLKKTVFKITDGGDRALVRVKKSGPCTITAGDLDLPHNVEVVNKDHILATLTRHGKLEMEITVERGIGYQSIGMRQGEGSKRFGVIYLDALYSPVRRAAFKVEDARHGQRTDLDRLILDIETNGSMDFEEVIRAATAILINQLSVFAQKGTGNIGLEEGAAASTGFEVSVDNELLQREISAIEDLGVRSQNCLRKENIHRIGDLVQKTEKELMKTPHLGRKTINEIKLLLDRYNLHLGMDLPDWNNPADSAGKDA